MQVSVVGIAWYEAEDYDRLKAMFTDGWKLPDTFADWQEMAHSVCETLTAEGHQVVKARIDPETFPQWCRDRGMEMDAEARTLYGTECARISNRNQRANKIKVRRAKRRLQLRGRPR
ncbi:MAG TPA: hypothetical protein VE621_24070 [Bryobacteraceae bacterium]|jgi:hypothetical protein|nr:hypothetical protein [Bryobacteraceae bacterium]